MDVLYGAYYLALFSLPVVAYIAFFAENARKKNNRYRKPEWYHFLKVLWAKPKVKEFQEECRNIQLSFTEKSLEEPKELEPEKNITDTKIICGSDMDKNSVLLKLTRRENDTIEAIVQIRLKNGSVFVLPSHPEVAVLSEHSGQFQGQGLSVSVVVPFRVLRVRFNGFLKNLNAESDGKVDCAQFNIIWNSGGRPLHYPQDFSTGLLADSLAKETWRNENWIELLGDNQGYLQFGAMNVLLQGDAFCAKQELMLQCVRRRYWGTSEATAMHRDFHIFGVAEDGTCVTIGAKSLENGCAQLPYGAVRLGNTQIRAMEEIVINLETIGENKITPAVFVLYFKVNSSWHTLVVHCDPSSETECYCDETDGWSLKTCRIEAGLNNQQLQGVASFWYARKGNGIQTPSPLVRPLTIYGLEGVFLAPLASRECRSLSLTGGKGNSLALLSSIVTEDFVVPDGFVVFTTALKHQITVRHELQEALKYLEDVYSGKVDDSLQKACEKTVAAFKSAPPSEPVAEEIRQQLTETLGTDTLKIRSNNDREENVTRWAIRSSGAGEDTDELSAAGQNATFLGVSTVEDVLSTVCACWGSLYAYQSVQYRKQHGQELISDMAVVVQKMVPADTAGVLFTCHPSTGNLGEMVITANYGLGESVVSAQADPDTIILSKTWTSAVSMRSSEIGAKKQKITMSTDVSGTEETENSAENRQKLCITEEQALLLGKIGVRLEKEFGGPRDIEWAFRDGKLHLLQSRPVTTLNTWTDFELLHEFDNPIFSKHDLHTTANVGEVLGGATSCLAQSFLFKYLDFNCQSDTMFGDVDVSTGKCIVPVQHHFFVNVMNTLYSNIADKVSIENQITDAALFGRVVLNEYYHKIAKFRFGPNRTSKELKRLANILKKCWSSESVVNECLRLTHNFNVPITNAMRSTEIYKKITDHMEQFQMFMKSHQSVTQASVFWQVFAMNILVGSSKVLENSHYLDIATFLSSCKDIVSAEVPMILEKLGKIIGKSKVQEKFFEIEPKDGVKWLKENCPEGAKELENFLKKHGHRGIGEFDFINPTWEMDPTFIIKMLQTNVKNPPARRDTVDLTPSEIVEKLSGSRNRIAKTVMKYFIQKCRKGVQLREITKSELISAVHKFRLAYISLAKKMVSEGYLPQTNLIFHLTHNEIGQLLASRDATVLSKAVRRQRLFPKWKKMKYPELVQGVIKPEEETIEPIPSGTGTRVTGTPVCTGIVTGRASVITDLERIHELQSGDILITTATDIGWSPYFPLLSGVVTELGGLISHGAVVAREYGLPCIVGVRGATRGFATGNFVRLDGFNGILEKIE